MFHRRLLVTVAIIGCAAAGFSQSLGELDAAQAGQAQLDGGSVTGGANVGYINRARNAANTANGFGGPTGALPNQGGFNPPPTTGLPGYPGATPYVQPSGPPGLNGPAAINAGINQPGQPGAAPTATPEPMIKVLEGPRVYCAVCGNLLEDPVQLTVSQSMRDKYYDDGIHDNGIKNDGIWGNVETIKDQYIGQECNSVKNRLINVVRNAENMDPMTFFGYHIMAVDPLSSHKNVPNLLDKEQQRDEALRDWNNKFLADYRKDKNDPKSQFYQLYVPAPPQPPHYPVPPGYISPQKLIEGPAGPGQPAVATPNIYNGEPVIGGGVI